MPYTKYCIEQKRCSDYVKKNYHDLAMFKAFVIVSIYSLPSLLLLYCQLELVEVLPMTDYHTS